MWFITDYIYINYIHTVLYLLLRAGLIRGAWWKGIQLVLKKTTFILKIFFGKNYTNKLIIIDLYCIQFLRKFYNRLISNRKLINHIYKM